ncbi:unnamed protein product [Musa acuminata subsp. malaccensis]|uniref:(wild Malaysian banana) hypothetical protein n=1 Tax=Musa acuminata subsp. malaccensis TaxID=214687 RepID=A0A804JEB5_MUSAM|nr:unnamed protein product [Musa acuminata subsp. malaccensis]
MAVASRLVLDGNPIRPATICLIGAGTVGAHHPWDFQIHFHRLFIKHVSIWFSFPFSRSCFGYPALPPCPALPFDLFLVNYSLSRRVVMYCLDSDKRLIRFTTCEVYGTETGSLLSKDHPLRKVPVSLLRSKLK